MIEKFKKFKNSFYRSMIVVVLLIFIGFTGAGKQSITIIERVIGDVFAPIVSITSRATGTVGQNIHNIINIPGALKENKELKEEVTFLRDENSKLHDIVSRSEYLKNEYEIIQNSRYEMVKAKVVGKAMEKEDLYLLDKGGLSGIKVSDTVVVGIQSSENVAIEGLVGKVEKVGDNWSKISLINKDDIGISFINGRTQEGGLIDSGDENNLSGYTYDNNADVVAEDRLYTSGLGEVFRSNVYIGRISSVQNDEDNMRKNIEVNYGVNLNKLNNVLVITGEKYED